MAMIQAIKELIENKKNENPTKGKQSQEKNKESNDKEQTEEDDKMTESWNNMPILRDFLMDTNNENPTSGNTATQIPPNYTNKTNNQDQWHQLFTSIQRELTDEVQKQNMTIKNLQTKMVALENRKTPSNH